MFHLQTFKFEKREYGEKDMISLSFYRFWKEISDSTTPPKKYAKLIKK